ncbi:hypothetical protein HWV62_38048 [Athelia sp. TMB]|nr:hypothetical protein HWV62_38048 [Athelia sp. TMB]
MSVELPKDLVREIHRIRNIKIWHSDLLPLINNGTKIPMVVDSLPPIAASVAEGRMGLWTPHVANDESDFEENTSLVRYHDPAVATTTIEQVALEVVLVPSLVAPSSQPVPAGVPAQPTMDVDHATHSHDSRSKKRKAIDLIEPAIDDCEADAEKSDGEAATGKKWRKPKRTDDERKNVLINDKWVKDFSKMQTPSLALQWRNMDPNSLKHTKSKASVELSPTQPLLVNCVHLSGPQYDTYIWLCHTQSLGGALQELHARAVRQLNPHKIKPPPLTQGRMKNPDLMIEVDPDADLPSTEVPVWGNTEKVAEAAKSMEFQHEALWKRRLFTPHTSRLDTDTRLLNNKLKNPLEMDSSGAARKRHKKQAEYNGANALKKWRRKEALHDKCAERRIKIRGVDPMRDTEALQKSPPNNIELDLQLESYRVHDIKVPKKDVPRKADKIAALVAAIDRYHAGQQSPPTISNEPPIQTDIASDIDEESSDIE